MNTCTQQVEEIHTQGYTIIEGLLNQAAMERVRSALSPWLQGRHME